MTIGMRMVVVLYNNDNALNQRLEELRLLASDLDSKSHDNSEVIEAGKVDQLLVVLVKLFVCWYGPERYQFQVNTFGFKFWSH
eukprot:1465940-Amphidinium_carterae.1